MILYRQLDGTLIDRRTGYVISVSELQEHILKGTTFRVFDDATEIEVTHSVLLDIIAFDLTGLNDSEQLRQVLDVLVRLRTDSSNFPNDQANVTVDFSMDTLARWAHAMLIMYDIWHRRFSRRYYVWDYPCLIANILKSHWEGRHLTTETAVSKMFVGSRTTKYERLHDLVAEGWVSLPRNQLDRRSSIVQPTPRLIALATYFFSDSFLVANEAVKDAVDIDPQVLNYYKEIRTRDPSDVDGRYLTQMADLILAVGYSWSVCFPPEMVNVEYWHLCMNLVLGQWRHETCTLPKINDLISHRSTRTQLDIVNQAIELGMVTSSRMDSDRRKKQYFPTPKLENTLIEHATYVLQKFIASERDLKSLTASQSSAKQLGFQ